MIFGKDMAVYSKLIPNSHMSIWTKSALNYQDI
jgi:hypothetical protein